MMTAAMSRRARELAAGGEAFVTATVVRAQRPTSVEAGDVALVLADGSIEGFVGGACAEHSVRAYSLEAMRTGEAVLLRILPFAEEGAADEVEDGAVTVQNPCLSVGAYTSTRQSDAVRPPARAPPAAMRPPRRRAA